MKRTFLTTLLTILVLSVFSQMNFRVNGLNISADKNAPSPTQKERLEKLNWSKVVSKCVKPGGVEHGMWFTYRAKSQSATITLKTGGKWGNIKDPILYVGSVIENKGQEILKEIQCKSLEGSDGDVTFSFNDLQIKKDYFILVASYAAQKGDLFVLHVSDKYTPAKEVAKEGKRQGKYVMGRVRSKNHEPKKGVMVTLLNQKMLPVESAYTDTDGTFEFDKLPIDEPVLARIEEDDSELEIDLYLFNESGEVEKRAVRMGSRLYSFAAVKNGFDDLRLLSERDWRLNIADGKTGVAGKIVDKKTFLFGQADVEVGLYGTNRKKLESTRTDADGNFSFRDIEKGTYSVKVEGDQSANYSEIVMVDDLDVPYSYSNSEAAGPGGFYDFKALPVEVVKMRRMEAEDIELSIASDFSDLGGGEPIVLNKILFESGSTNLIKSSYAELDRLAAALLKQADVRIEISGHTDNTGSDASNQQLSLGRAEAVRRYLESKGIDSQRLEHKGFGESKPRASNDNEEGRKLNRRVEFVKIP